MQLPGGESVLLTDTVGFVRKLPHQLVQAFTSTLDVVAEGDLLVHVVDASGPDPEGNIDAVRQVVREIGGEDVPELLVFNKADVDPDRAKQLTVDHPGSVAISAVTGEGIDELLLRTGDRLRSLVPAVPLFVPYSRGDVLAAVHRSGEVLSETAEEDGLRMSARLEASELARFDEFRTDRVSSPADRR